MLESWHNFAVLAAAEPFEENLAIVWGLWWGACVPCPAEVRDRLKTVLQAWFVTPEGLMFLDNYPDFGLSQLWDIYGTLDAASLTRALEVAGISDLQITVCPTFSDWMFSDPLRPNT